ncbi:MAG: hypothetical protein M1368_09945, partial [Thaumarchaeota archaeon]|nr:hypothetical protein [Nitrososphaerota archaeon]
SGVEFFLESGQKEIKQNFLWLVDRLRESVLKFTWKSGCLTMLRWDCTENWDSKWLQLTTAITATAKTRT